MTHTNIESLQADIEMIREIAKSYQVDIIAEIKNIFEKYITIPSEAMVVRQNVRLGIGNELLITCEVGFWNTEEERVDFGSDVSFDFTLETGLRINHGIMGYASKKDIYQMKRYNLFGIFYNNYDQIDAELKTLAEKARPYYDACIEIQEKELELNNELKKITEEYCAEIDSELKIGDIFKHRDGLISLNRVWAPLYNYSSDIFEIIKLTPKYVTLKALVEGYREPHIRREDFVRGIAEYRVVKLNG